MVPCLHIYGNFSIECFGQKLGIYYAKIGKSLGSDILTTKITLLETCIYKYILPVYGKFFLDNIFLYKYME